MIVIRTRIGHSRTQKEGWKHETTVEITSGVEDLTPEREAALYDVTFRSLDEAGRAESARRNELDGVPS